MKEVIQRAGVSSPAQAEAVLALRDEFDKACGGSIYSLIGVSAGDL